MFLLPAIFMFNIFRMPRLVAARFCEGGHYCSLPRECCTQGCCPPYQNGPRQLPPPSEHVLNLFFISHWFFWCVVVAIILAILCAYSLWKKRRTLCGWGFTEHRAQSEGDSAGSCYAPPQYSRCNSFHHPPPPYTEVTSKPDLYPLVFTCNSDNAKSGSSYLMVQYFRNYIVRPVGSLSAASTVDSLSSSFICNINEANTLVPPPYSRAASPETEFSAHFQQQFMMPRSASQIVYACGGNGDSNNAGTREISSSIVAQKVYQGQQNKVPHFTVVALNGSVGGNQSEIGLGNVTNSSISYNTILQTSVAENFNFNQVSVGINHNHTNNKNENHDNIGNGSGSESNRSSVSAGCVPKGFIQSQSDQQLRYINNSNNSISDIFINNSSVAAYANTTNASGSKSIDVINFDGKGNIAPSESREAVTTFSKHSPLNNHGTSAIFRNGHIKPNPLHRTKTNSAQLVFDSSILNPTYKSCDSVAAIPLTVPGAADDLSETELKELQLLRQSLETCCHILKQQKHLHQHPQGTINETESPPSRLNELTKNYTADDPRNYIRPDNCSAVSSLTNVCLPSSPPQATSPTGEVRDILEQIRQLQDNISYEDMLLHMKPALCNTVSSPTTTSAELAKITNATSQGKTIRSSVKCCEIQQTPTLMTTSPMFSKTTVHLESPSVDKGTATVITTAAQRTLSSSNDTENILKRPSTLQQHKRKLFTPKPNKALYIPMVPNITTTPSNRCILKSPVSSVVGTNFFTGRGGRVRKIWVSRSAPTTPGTALPPNRLSDDSPLLTDHDEDQETDQIENFK
ncbi:uncharacterized protein LOC128856777 [Anastrepha ludens]|uniref:uncharacterized protein LOC128856777 n=1 Tax=Anastrepha ludens TaxID=28586 RepID=UPI0023AE89A5|nr:uncharacterized protein LOC128856777 [Anastrepha ludens]